MNSVVILSKEDAELFKSASANDLQRYHKMIFEHSRTNLLIFSRWGFGDWFTFKKIILHFYPQVSENELYEFYTGKVVRQDVFKYVYYVYQIFQK